MKKIVITTEKVINGKADSWYIDYQNSHSQNVQTIFITHAAVVGGGELRYVEWNDILKYLPTQPSISDAGTSGSLTFNHTSGAWDAKPID